FGRIEEHGLHIFLGFYENAFHTMRGLYDELGRRPGAPLAKWTDAWKPQSFVVFMDQVKGSWDAWPFTFPTNASLPGDGGEWPSAWDYVEMMIGSICEWIEKIGVGPFAGWGENEWRALRDKIVRDMPTLRALSDRAEDNLTTDQAHPGLVA